MPSKKPDQEKKAPTRVRWFRRIRDCGEYGATVEEIQKYYGDSSQQHSRASDLVRLGVIYANGKERKTDHEGMASVYVVVPGATEEQAAKRPPDSKKQLKSAVMRSALLKIKEVGENLVDGEKRDLKKLGEWLATIAYGATK